MLIKKPDDIPSSEITPKDLYLNRRQFITGASALAAALIGGGPSGLLSPPDALAAGAQLSFSKSAFSTDEKLTPYKDVTNYNNYYEFSTSKYGLAELAKGFKPQPWTVSIEGFVTKYGKYDFDTIMKTAPLEERVYRMRCVEGWSMVIPWVGFPLSALIKRVEPTSKAKFIEFTSVYRPDEMPGQRRGVLEYPYVEGLRLDEALHPLTLLAVGLYGETLPNQNGAPLRLVVPWKYGFKGIKSIVKIRFVENQPVSSWAKAAPREYGFYANVNPEVDHPRWSQARERRLGEFFKRKTLVFNGYGEQVAHLYAGMDLRKNF